MAGLFQEELQELLQDLQTKENSVITDDYKVLIDAILALSAAYDRRQVFDVLIDVLKKYISFEDALALTKNVNASL